MVDAFAGSATVIPSGSMSVTARELNELPEALASSTYVSLLRPPNGTEAGAKLFVKPIRFASTVSVADAGWLSPTLDESTAEVSYTAGVDAVALTVTVQEAPAGSDAPEKLTTELPSVAVRTTAPPCSAGQVVVACAGDATMSPAPTPS